ncbi:MAG: Z1 domain-containing protein [Cetobacterium sp.]
MNQTQLNLKAFIVDKLLTKDEITLDDIKQQIKNVKIIMNSDLSEIIFPNCSAINENQYEELRKELESHFSITIDCGILLSDNNSNRDNHWWTSKEKQITDKYYWERYRKYIEKKLPKEVLKTLDIDTDIIMDNIENPNLNTFSRYGMVVGHVQSGKTGNYSGLICKAADAGYKFIVVIAGGLNNLRNQTQERINEYFVGTDGIKDLEIKKLSFSDNSKQPISLTTLKDDFNARDANKQTINFDNMTGPMILVVKKNVSTLKNVTKWIKSHTKNKVKDHAMLIIDDESDYASVNYKTDEDPTQINKCIRSMISLFEKSSYVAYTATPFANIFIDHKTSTKELGLDLFPKNFIYALDAPSNYMGAKKYFIPNEDNLDDENPNVVEINDFRNSFDFIQKVGHKVETLPESLKKAVGLFLINIGIRHLKGQENQHNSMLVHVSRLTGVHSQVSSLLDDYLNKIKEELISFGKLPSPEKESAMILNLKNTYNEICNNKDYSFDLIIKKIVDLVGTIFVREVHQKSKIPLVYRKDFPTNVIAVGGTSLSRGYTLEGLSVTYFTRNSLFYDTLMQMGRWFGYRDGYSELCKLFIPKAIINNFIKIINATDELMGNLNNMRKLGKTPEEFGLGVQYHPSTKLKITATNKMKSAESIPVRLDLQGSLKENAKLSKDENEKAEILRIIKKLIHEIEVRNYKLVDVGANRLWKDVDSKLILDFFKEISRLKIPSLDIYGFSQGFPITFIINKIENLQTFVDVAFFSIKEQNIEITKNIKVGSQKRKVGLDQEDYYVVNKQKLSGGHPERIILNNKTELTGKEIRQTVMEKPLLILHLLNLYIENKELEKSEDIDGIFGAFGIAFPLFEDKNFIENNTISLKVNSVYIEQFIKDNEFFVEDDEDYGDDLDA